MVWFQCEDCGEELKKPKLPNHFRICSAHKLSCIDCGVMFTQQTVQGHTQCITEAEKYGPKGQGKAPNASATKSNSEQKQKPDVDINVGLSERPPWFCSLCNTKTTSKQTLLAHADGKKHRAKARAHAAKQQPKPDENSAPDKNANGGASNIEMLNNKSLEDMKDQAPPKASAEPNNSEAENLNMSSKKKRKSDECETTNGNGEAAHIEKAEKKEADCQAKKSKHDVPKEDNGKKIKWKKLIESALKSNPDGVLKLRKLKKHVRKAVQDSGAIEDKGRFDELLKSKINSSSRFKVVDKYVHFIGKD